MKIEVEALPIKENFSPEFEFSYNNVHLIYRPKLVSRSFNRTHFMPLSACCKNELCPAGKVSFCLKCGKVSPWPRVMVFLDNQYDSIMNYCLNTQDLNVFEVIYLKSELYRAAEALYTNPEIEAVSWLLEE